MTGLGGTRILLGVSGGIAAYKAADLVRRLRERGAVVQVVMTEGAKRFVTPLTFQALSGRPVREGLWDEAAEAAMGHIELARWADLVLVAPASADLIARLAQGRADDLLTTLCLATAAPVCIAPAMNQQMWANAATQANIETLRTRGVTTLGPGVGDQACGETGAGRMLEPLEIASSIEAELGGPGPLAGSRVVITAGPTHEPLDPVRYIGNRSSGRMGFAIAEACIRAGAEVSLVSGPVKLDAPEGVTLTRVETAEQMFEAVQAEIDGADLFIGTAAVSDFRPADAAGDKLKKEQGAPELGLTENPDILAWVGAREPHIFTVGFAAETTDLEANARGKLLRKNLDLIAANLVGAGLGFDVTDNALSVFWKGGGAELARADKRILARELVALISERIADSRAAA
jgi:phosphopantothenoylcysteine decarboxylase/phosphopantothenate--cysteine ligase